MTRRLLACAAMLLSMTACGNDNEVEGPGPPETGPYRADVDWSAYESGLQRRIDTFEDDENCEALASELDFVPGERADDRRLRRYINEAMNAADCHSYS